MISGILIRELKRILRGNYIGKEEKAMSGLLSQKARLFIRGLSIVPVTSFV